MSEYTIKIPIGDWSDDGHGKCEVFEIESNYPVKDLQEAYKASCKLTGLQFNHNQNYTGLPEHNQYRTERHICTEYEDGSLSEFAIEVLQEHGINLDEILTDGEYLDPNSFARLILEFINLSMPKDWIWKFIENEGEYLNGFWNGNLNVQFGYGLF